MVDVVVVGLVCRDLVVAVDELPASGSAPVTHRGETLGGAANIAVAARRLGRSAGLVGVVGQDAAASLVLDQARRDGLDLSGIVRRPSATTALVVDVVEADGTHRLLEHVPPEVLLTPGDVRAAAPLLATARAVVADLQQPDPAVAETVRLAAAGGARVVLDGAPDEPGVLTDLLPSVAVLRADAEEAGAYLGRRVEGTAEAVDGARELLAAGPGVVALGAGADGNVVAWAGGHRVFPLLGDTRDATGGGDAFVAGLLTALLAGEDPGTAGWWGSAAAALAVEQLGGRATLDPRQVADLAARSARG